MKHKVRLRICIVILIAFILLMGCAVYNTSIPTSSPPSSLPTNNLTLTVLLPTQTLVSQNFKNIIASPCLEASPSIPADMKISWDILVSHEHGLFTSIFSLNDGKLNNIPYFSYSADEGNKFSNQFYVSPNGKWLAFQDTASSKLFIESTGTLLTDQGRNRIEWTQNEKFLMRRWVNNDQVLLIYWKPEHIGFITTILLNPFTGERHEISIEQLPNYLNYKIGGAVIATHYENDGELVPDPAIKKIIYPQEVDDHIYNILWDVEAKKPLARWQYYIGLFNDPLWSQNGSDFLVMSPIQDRWLEWLQITKDGNIKRITYYAEFLQQSEYYFLAPSRSWDGRYLSFMLSKKYPDESTNYVILDLQSENLTGFCVDSTQIGREQRLVWSPDNKYLLLSNRIDNSVAELILVDVAQRQAYRLENSDYAIGWTAKP